MTDHDQTRLPAAVLTAWPELRGRPVSPVAIGNINNTYRVPLATPADDEPPRAVIVQRVHPIFGPEVHTDIEAVSQHLAAKGLCTPRLLPTTNGALYLHDDNNDDDDDDNDNDGGIWRVQTLIAGKNVEKVDSPALAFAAGELCARFHQALSGFDYRYRHTRGQVHDTASHAQRLEAALEEFRDHRLFAAVAPLAEEVLAATQSLPDFDALPLRHSHGDLKISNLIFSEAGGENEQGLCLIDLDTLSLMPWPYEMGDALRSWCNPRPEDARPVCFEIDLFAAALQGYASVAPSMISAPELELLVSGVRTICLELSARFLDDALRESYFGFDAKRYASAGDHHLARGRCMRELAASVDEQWPRLQAIVGRLFG